MPRVRDLQTVLDVAREIGGADGLDAYRATVLAAAPRLVPGDVYGYNEVPRRREEPVVLMSERVDAPEWDEAIVGLADEHPLVIHYIATGDPDARAISELVSRRAHEASPIYRHVLSYCAGRDQLAVSIPGEGGLTIGLAVNRSRRGFSARDHAMYDTVRPFLLQGYENAVAADRSRRVVAALGATAAATDQPVVLVGPRGRVEHMTPGAAELLGSFGDRLREPLAGWLREQRRRPVPSPARVNGFTARLVREAADGIDAIVLSPAAGITPQALRATGLTRREADVMALVADGLSNAGVAGRLGISEATVAKHLQHVNEKLGVTSRTAAVARLRERVTGIS